jgi:ABC-type nitrate/sulfonate/bicarbonate transport system substrate-binding protein
MKAITARTITFITAGLAVLGGLTVWYWAAPSRSLRPNAGPVEKLTVSTLSDNLSSALLVITQEKGYFRDNGLEVTLKFYPTGVLTLEQLQTGHVDLAHVGDFVLVGELFKGAESLRCLGSIGAMDIFQVMARRDKGISHPSDLKNKRVGVARGTASEFFLGTFLTLHNILLTEVKISNLDPIKMAAALANDQVDAVMAWEPITYEIKKRLGDKVIAWSEHSGRKFYNPLVSTNEVIKARSKSFERLFRALKKGETFIKENQEESLAIIAKWLKLDPASFKADWLNSDFELSFDQSLLLAMEDEARWMIWNKMVQQTEVPDYLNYFDVEPLAKAVPEAVQIYIPKGEGYSVPGPAEMEQGHK